MATSSVFYRKCLVQLGELSAGQPLLDLASLFRKYLREFTSKGDPGRPGTSATALGASRGQEAAAGRHESAVVD